MLSHLKSVGDRLRPAAAHVANHRRTPAVLTGFFAGIAGWSAAHPFVARFGFNHETLAALLIVAAGSFAAGLRLARRPALTAWGLPLIVTAGWLVLLPLILTASEATVTAAPAAALAKAAVRLPLLLGAALLVFAVPSAGLGLIVARRSEPGDGPALLVSAGLGLATIALLLAPAVGLHAPLLAVALAAAVVWFVRLVRGTTSAPNGSPLPAAVQGDAGPLTTSEAIRAAGTAACIGVACATSARALAQLTPEAGYLLASGAAAFLAGTGLGATLARRWKRSDHGRLTGAWIAAAACLMPLAMFSWLVDRHLDADAFVSSVTWLMTLRIGTVAAVFLPLGAGLGLAVCRPAGRSQVTPSLAGLAAGLALAGWMVPAAGVIPSALIAATVLLLGNVPVSRPAWPQSRRGWAAAAVGIACLVIAAANAGRYEPARAARLLFSTQVFIARQGGVPGKLLPFLDDARLVASDERSGGTVTLWKQRGDGFVVRLNGVPVAATCARPDLCPLPSADVLRVALPLVLHEAPASLLLLGDPAGLATSTAAGFPLREIVCYDAPNGARSAAEPRLPHVSDDRVTARVAEPRLAVAAERRTYDVIVSDPGTPSLPAAAPYFTREFYADAARRLSESGVFCQRLRYADFGPEPLRVLAATTRGLFGEVMTIEAGAGEYLLLAAPRGQALVRDGLVGRLQRPQVRRTLAALGWDWCVPLNLASVEQEGLDALAAEARGANTDSNALLSYTLPQEVMRWGPKGLELQQATAGKTSRLFVRGVPEDGRRDVLDRLAEVAGERELMTKFPDQPWAYRKEIRTKLKESPRTTIRPVAGEVQRALHPEDQRRLDYFAALGDAAKAPTAEHLSQLDDFARPYDPLVTYFLHHEAAPLYAKLGPAGSAAELAHRLYAAYYADPRDRSVRNVIAAIDLVVERPALVEGDAERFDRLNGLIEVLLGRWKARGMAEPKSPEVVLVDVDKSLAATRAALDAMRPLAASAGLSEHDWSLREAAVDRTLTRPLRTYRTSLLPYLRAAQKSAAKGAAAASSETEREADRVAAGGAADAPR